MWKYTVKVDGMMCGMCESHVNDAIRKGLTVKKVKASKNSGQVVVVTEENLTEEDFHRVLDPTGYEMGSVSKEEYKHKLFGI